VSVVRKSTFTTQSDRRWFLFLNHYVRRHFSEKKNYRLFLFVKLWCLGWMRDMFMKEADLISGEVTSDHGVNY